MTDAHRRHPRIVYLGGLGVLLVVVLAYTLGRVDRCESDAAAVVVAILAKDKAHILPYYLEALYRQTYPKSAVHLWVRSNNNNDETVEVLRAWLHQHGHEYASVSSDFTDVPESVQYFAPHEWNALRFRVLGRIRQQSVQYAIDRGAHYFVVDCDNLLYPSVLERLVQLNRTVVAPMLRSAHGNGFYSNYHSAIDANGYYATADIYYDLLHRRVVGVTPQPVVHCTYLVSNAVLPHVSYDDDSRRYEYVIFSHSMRRADIVQYLDNREEYGFVSMADTRDELLAEPWFNEYRRKMYIDY